MSSKTPSTDDIVRPMQTTGKKFYIVFALAAVVGLAWIGLWLYQVDRGLAVTNLSDWGSGGGVTWGLYIGAFIWWVGIAHGGIILSAAVRLFGMKKYQPVARLAELLTLGALSMAGFYIVVHMGRPDRMVTSIVDSYPVTVHQSPLVWDVTVITLYMVMTATYLALTLRYDMTRLRDDLPNKLEPLYKVMTIGYTKKEDQIIERMVWWLALGIIVMAPLLLHGGVIPWLFALVPSMPGWDGAVQGPQFLSIALTSALAGVIILSTVLRRGYDWYHILTDKVVQGLTLWLGLFSLLFLWLQLQQIITGVYAAPVDEAYVTMAKITSPVYWFAIGLVIIALAYIFAQAVKPEKYFTATRSIIASVMVLVGTLVEKVFFVVEGLQYPTFGMYYSVPGDYFPSPIELASVAGTIALCTLFFMAVLKLFPVIELHAIEHLRGDGHGHSEADD
ncbi:probable anaerobic dehydrogenase membrane anchor subunit [Natronomonas pharaonis DSM 2160]|uniref:Probable anaerobic dehydrogenase membrane anchor subunit n=1 Tax=Natronomonas pharaonis (strain ATCC 35678 / DSM 2160 / CIP 103997 / JCM 8858 / NBRC 14720 / NCIMB 2260 / Gabara) TaxID=348780 RepID=A0A1U7EZ68_NATPD|nr:NrfD/PsrC family molybdoenzyme membrane anchor subunit [Natronomonas pharaonis]CAI50563.1 probable anaerobic dehydrogenase membrane anchor subunit [Natronomonas pharaonis DSM 2160]